MMDEKERLIDDADYICNNHIAVFKNVILNKLNNAYNRGYETGLKEGQEEVSSKAVESAWNEAYQKGLEDMLDVIRDAYYSANDRPSAFTVDEMNYFYGNTTLDSVLRRDAEGVMTKARRIRDSREAKQNNVRVGDELINITENGFKKPVIVTSIHDDDKTFDGITADGDTYAMGMLSFWHKTGRHFDIDGILCQMKEKTE